MSKRYTGNFISGTPQVPTLTSNNGIFDIKDVYTATSNNAWQEPDGYYEIGKSLRFRGANSNYLSRSQAADGNRKAWTFSAWVKLGGDNGFYMCAGGGTGIGVDVERMQFNNSGNGWYWQRAIIQTSTTYQQDTNGRWRDPSAWYHIMCIWDSNNANQAERWRTFVNGVKQTRSYGDGAVSQGQNSLFNSTAAWKIGRQDDQTSGYSDCYMAEVNFIDGQVLDPSYFGYYDPVTNIWQPKPYTGTYGTYGFYLPFNEPAATSGTVNAVNLGRNFVGSNYLKYSQDGSQQGTTGTYIVERATQTANTTTAPDGTTTANTLTADTTASNTHRWYIQTSTNPPTGSTQTTSIYLKYNNCRYINIENWNGSTYQTQTFDLLNGVPMVGGAAVSATGFTYQYVGNGWYRVSVPLYAGYTTATPSLAIYLCDSSGNASWTGNGTSAVYWWGSQLNIGTTPDPYIKTTSSPIINDWTTNNFSVTAGVTYDSMVDSPTNVGTNVTDTGGVVPGNYCTLNPLSNGNTLSNANLKAVTGTNTASLGTLSVSSGKWYYEATITTVGGNFPFVGIIPNTYYFGSGTASWAGSTPALWVGNGGFANGDVIGVAFDLDTLTFNAYKNGTLMTVASGYVSSNSISAGYTWTPITSGVSSTIEMNFGQRPFTYTPPAGYKSLNTTNMQALGTATVGNAGIAPHKWFGINLYGGNGSPQSISNGNFTPDFVWSRARNSTYSYNIADSVRGAGLRLLSDATNNEANNPNGGVSSFSPALTQKYGYQIDTGVEVNEAGRPYVSWQWKQSPTAGFNIVSYSANGTANRAISHNLGVTPNFIMVKDRTTANNWNIWMTGFTANEYLLFTGAGKGSYNTLWYQTPTSSNFYIGSTGTAVNYASGNNYIAYLFAAIPGFSAVGTYVGNSSTDGTFVYTGFKPKFVMVHALGTANGTNNNTVWTIWDTSRNIYNPTVTELYPYASSFTEATDSAGIDILSNGFKLKRNSEYANWSGTSYMYIAFAESPFALNNRAR